MVNKIKLLAAWLLIAAYVAIASGCAKSYRFGDFSKAYCNSTSEEFRVQAKATLTDMGVQVDINYCASVNLIDALIVREGE